MCGTAYIGEDAAGAVVKKKERIAALDSIGILDICNVQQLILLNFWFWRGSV